MTSPRSYESSGTRTLGDFSLQLGQVVLLPFSSQKGVLGHGIHRLSSACLSFQGSALVAVVLPAFHSTVFISLLADQAGMLFCIGLLVGQFQSGKGIPVKLMSKHPKKCSLSSPFACSSPEKASKRLQACLCVQQKLSVSLVPYGFFEGFFLPVAFHFFLFFFLILHFST